MKRSPLKILLTFIIFVTSSLIQAQTFPWAKSANGTGTDEGIAICNDAAGNVFVTGQFTSPVITFGTFTLANTGSSTIFLVKYDANGNVVWAKKATGSTQDYGNSVSCDAAGNIFLAGYFMSPTVVFGTYTLTNAGSNDIFIAMYDPAGNVIWAQRAGGVGNDNGYSVKADASGNAYLSGSFGSNTIVFGTYTLTNSGVLDAFLVKYNSSGAVLWAVNPIGTGADESWSACPDASGNVYMTGDFISSTLTFGTFTVNNIGTSTIFLTKYDNAGNALWVRTSGVSAFDKSNWVTVDALGNSIITGDYEIPSLIFGTYTLTNNGNSDAFITKYDPAGNVIWAKSAGGINYDKGYCVSADPNFIYYTGSFTNTIVFGSYTLTSPVGAPDPMFIVTYDYAGNVMCATALSSGGDDQNGISADKLGHAYFTSDFINPLVVGPTTLTPTGGENFFVSKYVCVDVTVLKNNKADQTPFVFPNPNNGKFKIEMNNEFAGGELILINSVGQKVHSQKISAGENNINGQDLPRGLYNYLIFKNNLYLSSGKIIVE